MAERDGHAFIAPALLRLGVLARSRVAGAIGVTGSVGKTTTKDLLAGCLASTFRTHATERSFNNELGLPLTLLNAPEVARWVVLETDEPTCVLDGGYSRPRLHASRTSRSPRYSTCARSTLVTTPTSDARPRPAARCPARAGAPS